MDTAFAKIVTDLDGRDHMLIDGTIISLKGGDDAINNATIEAIVVALRKEGRGTVSGASNRTDDPQPA